MYLCFNVYVYLQLILFRSNLCYNMEYILSEVIKRFANRHSNRRRAEMDSFENYFFGSGFPQIMDEKGAEFYIWRYDDGTEAGVAIDVGTDEEIYAKIFENAFRRKAFQKVVKERSQKKNLSFDKNKLCLHCGIDKVTFKANGVDPFPLTLQEVAKNGTTNLLRMLEACGQDVKSRAEVFQLFSALLSSYYFRFLSESALLIPPERLNLHAPILACNLKDGSEALLRDIVASVAIDTSDPYSKEEYGELSYHQPCCLPTDFTNRKITNCAYIQLRKSKKKFFDAHHPAQYRDTGVFLSARFFSGRDLMQFQQRNLWATQVLYGIRDQNLLMDPIRLDGSIFAKYAYESSWDTKSVFRLIVYFITWIQKRLKKKNTENFKNRLQDFDHLIAEHNRKRGTKKIRGIQKFWLLTQLLVTEEFVKFGTEVNCWSENEGAQLLAEWNHLLLPECCPYPQMICDRAGRQQFVLPNRDCVALFEDVLKHILEEKHWGNITYVPPKGKFSSNIINCEVWGFVRDYQSRKSHQRFLTLQIREVQLVKIAGQLSSVSCDWYEILKCLRKKEPPYLLSSKIVRMPGIGTQEKTLILDVAQLSFLSEKVLNFLRSMALLPTGQPTHPQ